MKKLILAAAASLLAANLALAQTAAPAADTGVEAGRVE